MNRFRLIIVVIVTGILQTALFSRINIFGATPSLALPVIVALSMGLGYFTGGLAALFLGLIEDSLFSPILGPIALIYFIFGYMVGNYNYKLNYRDYRTGILITLLLTVINFGASFGMAYLSGGLANAISYAKGPILIELVLNGLIYYIVMRIFKRLFIFPNVSYY